MGHWRRSKPVTDMKKFANRSKLQAKISDRNEENREWVIGSSKIQ